MGGPTAERVPYAPLPCLSARAICFKPHALRDDGDKSRTSTFRHPTGSLSMISIDGNWRAAAAAVLLATGGSAMAGYLGGPVVRRDEGQLFLQAQPARRSDARTPRRGIP